jgi:hypothetical protein
MESKLKPIFYRIFRKDHRIFFIAFASDHLQSHLHSLYPYLLAFQLPPFDGRQDSDIYRFSLFYKHHLS